MYIIGVVGYSVDEYDLGVAWDISTAVWFQLFSLTGGETSPEGLFFKPDGTGMYTLGTVVGNVNEYNLPVDLPVGTNTKINRSNSFKDISEIKINIGNVWKPVVKVLKNIGGVWKTVFG
ncbi:hypothetical protein ES705_36305 [subsurface metagenome]